MKIRSVRGGTQFEKNILWDSAFFIADSLNLLSYDVSITIFKKNIILYKCTDGLNLQRLGATKDITSSAVSLYLYGAGIAQPLQTLCHEMVHVNQIATNRLKVEGMSVFWEDQYYGNIQETPYKDRPWEKEALAIQDILFYNTCRYFGLDNRYRSNLIDELANIK